MERFYPQLRTSIISNNVILAPEWLNEKAKGQVEFKEFKL